MEGKKPKAKYLYLDKFERYQKITDATIKGLRVRIDNAYKQGEINRLTARDENTKLKSYFLIQVIINALLLLTFYYYK